MALIRHFVGTRDGTTAPFRARLGPQASGHGRLRGRVMFAEAKTTAKALMFPVTEN